MMKQNNIKPIQNPLIILSLLLAVAGCKVGDPYERPDLNQPESFYGNALEDDSIRAGSENMARMGWKTFFEDTTLVSLIDTALTNNIDMQKAAKNIEISLQELKQSNANFFPSLSVEPLGYVREHYSENYNNYGSNRSRRNHGENPPTSLYTERLAYTSVLQSSWEVDIWGKLQWQKEAARAAYMESAEFTKALQTLLVSEVATAYFNLLMLNAQIEVSERSLALNDSTLKIVNLQYEAGEITSLAIQQTESQRLRAEALIPQLEREYIIQENRLNRLLGRAPQALEIEGSLETATFEDTYSVGVPLELINNRPDVAAAEYRLQATNARVGVTKAMRYPSLTINAGMGLNSFDFSSFLDPMGSAFAFLNGSLFQPIFQNRRLKTNYKIALAERDIAGLDFKDNLIAAINEVSNALVTIEKLEEEYRIAQQRIAVTEKGVNDAFFLFRSGFANYLEVITAQRDALESELDLVRVKMQLYMAKIELYRSLGGGWQ